MPFCMLKNPDELASRDFSCTLFCRNIEAETKKWFEEILNSYELESHHVKLLLLAAEAWDRISQARKEIKKHGLLTKDRYGGLRANPATAIERDNKILFARLIRELGFDLEKNSENNRPPRLY